MPKLDAIALHNAAHAAGMAASNALTPTPMLVADADIFGNPKPDGQRYYVPSGVCGFAWVHFAGNTSFGRQMKKAGLARKDYYGGLTISVSAFGQSMEKKEAYAQAYAAYLRVHGVEARASSRMD